MPQLDPNVAILGTGSALPERRVTNDELAPMITGYDESSGNFAQWVDRVAHIQARHFVDPEKENVGTLGLAAARSAIDAAAIDPAEIDHVIFASFTYHDMFPGEHMWLVRELGLKAGTFNLAAACAGSLWGVTLARSLVQSGQCRNVLVVGVETLSRVMDWHDPITAILFSDAAGAVIVGRKDDGNDTGFIGPSVWRSDYAAGNIEMWNANAPLPGDLEGAPEGYQKRAFLLMQGGPRVLRRAVNAMAGVTCEALGYTMQDLKEGNPALLDTLSRVKLIPHQANGRIVDGLQEKLQVPVESCYRTIYFAGNSSAATNLVTLDYGIRTGNLRRDPPPEGSDAMGKVYPCGETIKKGDLVVVTSIGAGYLYGAFAFVHAY